MSNKENFKRVVTICEAEIKTLEKAIALDPEHTQDYEQAIKYSEYVVKMAKINVQAIDIIDKSTKSEADNIKVPDETKTKPKSKAKAAPEPAVQEEKAFSFDDLF